MSLIPIKINNDTPFFDNEISQLGHSLAKAYNQAEPFPHIVIDDFLPPSLLKRVLYEFPIADQDGIAYNRSQERYKKLFNPDTLASSFTRSLFYAFNANPFLNFMQGLTGIKGLLPDPTFEGGGFHQTGPGGHLGVHADFNLHPDLKVRRRINLIIFINEDWKEEYGGHLELWEKDMSKKVKSVLPVFNRAVIFNTEDDSFHGHPNPLTCPAGRYRKSMALYYYTASELIFSQYKSHSTLFKARKLTNDKVDITYKMRDLIRDCLPPVVARSIRNVKARLKK